MWERCTAEGPGRGRSRIGPRCPPPTCGPGACVQLVHCSHARNPAVVARRAARTTSRKDPPCSALTRPALCVPTTQARPSPSPVGWRGVETTAGSPSSTCATPRGVAQVVARDEVLAQGGAHDVRNEFCVKVTGEVRDAPRGQRQPRPADRRDRGHRQRARGAQPRGAAAVPDRRAGHRRRGGPPQAPLPRPAPPGRAARPAPRSACARKVNAAARAVLGARDFVEIETPDPDPLDAGGRPRLPRARAPRARAPGTPCRRARSCSSSCSWSPAWSATTRSPAATATRTSAPTASRSSPSSTSR